MRRFGLRCRVGLVAVAVLAASVAFGGPSGATGADSVVPPDEHGVAEQGVADQPVDPGSGVAAGTVLSGVMRWGAGGGGLSGVGYVGFARRRSTEGPDLSGGFELGFADGSVVRNRWDLLAVAQFQGVVPSGPAAGLSFPVVVTLSEGVDLSGGFVMYAGGHRFGSESAVNPLGDGSGFRYWMWDAPCVRWADGDESEFAVVASGPDGSLPDGLSDASLGSLSIVDAVLEGAFDAAVLGHAAVADAGIEQVTVDAAAAQPDACGVEISPPDADGDASNGHQVDLGVGDNAVSVSVTAADNVTVLAYEVTVTRLPPLPALTVLEASDTVLTAQPDISDSHYSGVAIVGTEQVTVTAVPDDPAATIEISPIDADADADGHQIDLEVGDNAIAVTVVAADDVTVRVYEVSVTRPPPPTLAVLELTDTTHTLQLAPDVSHYTAAVADGIERVTVTAITDDAGATVEIAPDDADADSDGHQVEIGSSDAAVTVTVTAADGATTRAYTVAIGRAVRPASAGRVALSGVDVEFSPAQSRYDTVVPRRLTETSVELTPAGDSTLRGFAFTAGDTQVAPIGDDGSVTLTAGRDTLIAVRAASPGHLRERLYTFRLRTPPNSNNGARSIPTLRAAAKNAPQNTRNGTTPQLTMLTVAPGTLDPVFAAAKTDYTLSVPFDADHLSVTPTPQVGATVTYFPAADADPDTADHEFALNPTQGNQPSQTAVMVIVTDEDSNVNRYTITVTRDPHSTFEPFNADFPGDTNTTGRIGTNDFLKGEISTAGDVDWYSIDLKAGTRNFFYLLGDSGEYYNSTGNLRNTWITGIYKADGTQAATPHWTSECNDPGSSYGFEPSFAHVARSGHPLIRCGPTFWETSGSMVYFVPETGGTYFIGAASLLRNNTGTYTLIQRERFTGDQAAHHVSFGEFLHPYPLLTVGETTASFLEWPRDRDNFQVELTAGRRYRFMGSRASDVTGKSLRINPGFFFEPVAIEDALNWSDQRRCLGPHLWYYAASFIVGDIWRVSVGEDNETVYTPVGTEALMCLLFNEFTAPATGKYIIQVYSYNNDGAAGWGGYKLTVTDVTDD